MLRVLSFFFRILKYKNTPIRFRTEIGGVEYDLRIREFCNEQLIVNGKDKGITTWVELEPCENNED